MTVEHSQLVVAGRREVDSDKADGAGYLHRGIAARGFMRTFVLADGMEVEAATLEHGLLHVDVVRPEPEKHVKRIPDPDGGLKPGVRPRAFRSAELSEASEDITLT